MHDLDGVQYELEINVWLGYQHGNDNGRHGYPRELENEQVE